MNKLQKIKDYFKLDDRNSTIKKEVVGGLTTFLAMAYILAVQPGMMSGYPANMPYGGIYLATVISSFAATFAMGLFANVPVSLAPGMGINAFFVYTVCGTFGIDPYQALSIVLISGMLYFILAITPARSYLNKAFSKNLKLAIGASIGVFIGFVGLQQTGIVQSDASAILNENKELIKVISPVAVKFGNLKNPLVLLSIFVLFLMLSLHFLRIKGGIIIAMLIGVVVMAVMYGAGVKILQGEKSPFKLNDFKEQFTDFGKVAGKSYENIGKVLQNPLAYIAIFVFLYTDFFDTTGTLFAIDQSAKLSKMDKTWLQKANIVDATGTMFGASIGASTVTSYVESQAGISVGARTGLSAIITSSFFLLAIFFYPIIRPLMPITNAINQNGVINPSISPITGPALVVVGVLMMMQLKEFDWKEVIDIPMLFMTVLLTMLTYSISSGIAAGVITFTILNFAAGMKQIVVARFKNNKKFHISDYGEMPSTDLDKIKKPKIETNYLKRINIGITILFVLSLVYFGTTVLYLDY